MLRKIFAFLYLMFAFAGCRPNERADKQDHQKNVTQQWNPPPAGTVVDKFQERVAEDNLNEKYFRITVIATEESKAGAYLLKLEYGFNINETTIDLPKWTNGTVLKPVLKKGAGAYSCLLGFDTGDGQFRELYAIKAQGGDVTLKQTKGYYQTK
jgi:hypothetical protein